jgi:hypothetical protein
MQMNRAVTVIATVAVAFLCTAVSPTFAQSPAARDVDNRWVVPYVGASAGGCRGDNMRSAVAGSYVVRRWTSLDWRMLNVMGVFSSNEPCVRFDTGANLHDAAGRFLGLAAGASHLAPGSAFLAAYAGTPVHVGSFEFIAETRLEVHRRDGRAGIAALLTVGVPLLR